MKITERVQISDKNITNHSNIADIFEKIRKPKLNFKFYMKKKVYKNGFKA